MGRSEWITPDLEPRSPGGRYALAAPPRLWVAVWPEDDCTIAGRLYLLPNE